MEEKRKIIQEKVYDENGKLEYVKIPNYKAIDYFMSDNEISFYRFLSEIVSIINDSTRNVELAIFPQVALNRIIQQNNRREKELEKDLFGKSIDFVIFEFKSKTIIFCIELDGFEHDYYNQRIERDKIVEKAFESSNIKLYRQPNMNAYDKNEYFVLFEEELKSHNIIVDNNSSSQEIDENDRKVYGRELLKNYYNNASERDKRIIDEIRKYRKNKGAELGITYYPNIFRDKDIYYLMKINPKSINDIKQSQELNSIKNYAEDLIKIFNN